MSLNGKRAAIGLQVSFVAVTDCFDWLTIALSAVGVGGNGKLYANYITNNRELFAVFGDSSTLVSAPSFQFDTGVTPSLVVTKENVLVHTHQSQNEETLYATVYDLFNPCETGQAPPPPPTRFPPVMSKTTTVKAVDTTSMVDLQATTAHTITASLTLPVILFASHSF